VPPVKTIMNKHGTIKQQSKLNLCVTHTQSCLFLVSVFMDVQLVFIGHMSSLRQRQLTQLVVCMPPKVYSLV